MAAPVESVVVNPSESESSSNSDLEAPDYQINRIESRLSRAQSATNAARPDPEKPLPEPALQTGDTERARQIRGFRWLLVCVSLYISAFLYGLDTTIAADVQ